MPFKCQQLPVPQRRPPPPPRQGSQKLYVPPSPSPSRSHLRPHHPSTQSSPSPSCFPDTAENTGQGGQTGNGERAQLNPLPCLPTQVQGTPFPTSVLCATWPRSVSPLKHKWSLYGTSAFFIESKLQQKKEKAGSCFSLFLEMQIWKGTKRLALSLGTGNWKEIIGWGGGGGADMFLVSGVGHIRTLGTLLLRTILCTSLQNLGHLEQCFSPGHHV